ncbi:cation diffusion facilitator family transporter [Bacteriovorax sp. Seq25_V]|uniref:cation diffusion facilitator family transporter n=1 Tax=Bacteriovorax sp. Seq25_V TaxID=1201288 RepID=UPI00038A136B|nr:cation diffusion facilitator family transporter [Bacteriovorax sp. Seq25_V]EQC45602.1 cation diffusion facilitator family transporter [Bacteriovorax sp. Seq25_V]
MGTGHHHGHGHHHHHHGGSGNILIAFFLNASFAVVEFIGGYLTNSVAIYSDAIHDLGDSLALLFAYFSEKMGNKAPDENYTYGYKRFSVISALINGVILLTGSLFVIMESIERISNPQPVHPEGMLGLALLGITINGVAAFRLSKDDGLNQRMVMLHLMEDILGWIAVLVVSIVLLFKPWFILDSILSIVISIVILRGVYKNLIGVGEILLQKFPKHLDLEKIYSLIRKIDCVNDVHGIQGFSVDESNISLSFHVSVSGDLKMLEVDKIKKKIKHILVKNQIKFSSIEFESDGYDCSENDDEHHDHKHDHEH